jgi:hypothetical protein
MGLLRKVALMTMCFGAEASFAADQGFYFGLNAGQAKYDFEPIPLAVAVAPGPFFEPFNPFAAGVPSFRITPDPVFGAPTSTNARAFLEPFAAYWIPGEDDEATAWGAFVGYRIFPYAAVEFAYADLGSLHEYHPARAITPLISSTEVRRKLETTGPAVSALAMLPINDRWDVFLRGGWYFADQKVTFEATGFPGDRTTFGTDGLLFGAGTQYGFGDHWTVRLDFQRYDDVGNENGAGHADIDVFSLGVLFRL